MKGTANSSRHPMIELTLKMGEIEDLSAWKDDQRATRVVEIINRLKRDGVKFDKGGAESLVNLAVTVYELETAALWTGMSLQLDPSLTGQELAIEVQKRMLDKAARLAKHSIATTRSNLDRKSLPDPETFRCLVEAFLELFNQLGKPPGGKKLATRTRQIMAAKSIPLAKRDWLTRYRAAKYASELREAFEM
jgi:hypothetical protein